MLGLTCYVRQGNQLAQYVPQKGPENTWFIKVLSNVLVNGGPGILGELSVVYFLWARADFRRRYCGTAFSVHTGNGKT